MDLIDVPVISIPSSDDEFDGVKFADALLTSLLSVETAVLQAEYKNTPPEQIKIIWELKKQGEEVGSLIATVTSLGKFRNILVRFGHHYMDGQLYNGYAQKSLLQRGRVHHCHFYMSNLGVTGFWIRIYAFKTD